LKPLKQRGGARPGAGQPKGNKSAKVKAREAAQAAYLEREGLSAVRVLEELRRLSFADPRGFWLPNGDLKPIADLTAEQAACLAGFEVVIKNAKAGDGQTDTVHKIKFWDKPRALEMLAKHFALLTERIEHSGGIDIAWKDNESK
jgi:phage terminase small subunit